MKILLGIVIGAGLVFGSVALAYEGQIPVRDFGIIAGEHVYKFVDPDNGYVCYLSNGGYSGGISCLKP